MCGIKDRGLIHVTDIDEFIADLFMGVNGGNAGVISLSLTSQDSQGNLAWVSLESDETIEAEGVDFELSPSELRDKDMDMVNSSKLLNKTVYTSSAHEFFDYLLQEYKTVECLLDFDGSAWRIKILDLR